MRNLFYCLFILTALSSCKYNQPINSVEPENSHYGIAVKIDPGTQFISVKGNLNYLVEKDSLAELVLNLHKQFQINSLMFNGGEQYKVDTISEPLRWQPHAIKYIYRPGKVFTKGEKIKIDFSYQGNITDWPAWSANVIDTNWVEMGLYFPWYLQADGLFTYDLSVSINPEYNVFAQGNYQKVNGLHKFKSTLPVGDFIICASKDLKIRETKSDDFSFKIVNSSLAEQTVDSIQSDVIKIFKNYESWLGSKENLDISLVISKRAKGGGYARKGALYLGGFSDSTYFARQQSYIRYLSHEIAHFWWNSAEHNWEDWLNESFAEYSALLILKDLFGEGVFDNIIEGKKVNSQNTPAIWELERSHAMAEKVLYSKGAVHLYELENKIGKENFLNLLEKRIKNNINTTQGFLDLIKAQEGEEASKWFEHKLKNE